MTTTDTRDVEGTVAQVKRCADAGANMVRLTVQGKKEAETCFEIRERLLQVRVVIVDYQYCYWAIVQYLPEVPGFKQGW